jgi:hypothetical protein
MERTGIHELSAAYALDALSADERQEFEEHLAHCAECQETVAAFHDTAASLAHGVEAQQPPPELRSRILVAARGERENVVPLRPRWALRATGAVAAVAAILAIVFGIWAASLHNELGGRPQAFALTGAEGQLVVTPDRDAALIVNGLAPRARGQDVRGLGDPGRHPAGRRHLPRRRDADGLCVDEDGSGRGDRRGHDRARGLASTRRRATCSSAPPAPKRSG